MKCIATFMSHFSTIIFCDTCIIETWECIGLFLLAVTKLREHWDDTNSTVLNRKTQLDAMLQDSHKLEGKRAEVEAWLGRLEKRLERSPQMAPQSNEMLDHQIREQKVNKKKNFFCFFYFLDIHIEIYYTITAVQCF